jgi:hypothetical protein
LFGLIPFSLKYTTAAVGCGTLSEHNVRPLTQKNLSACLAHVRQTTKGVANLTRVTTFDKVMMMPFICSYRNKNERMKWTKSLRQSVERQMTSMVPTYPRLIMVTRRTDLLVSESEKRVGREKTETCKNPVETLQTQFQFPPSHKRLKAKGKKSHDLQMPSTTP